MPFGKYNLLRVCVCVYVRLTTLGVVLPHLPGRAMFSQC